MEHHNTILACFLHWEATCPEDVFLRQPIGKNWKVYSWKDAGALSRNILRVLRRHGFNYGDRMAILSANCAEWIIYDLAMMMGGFISVPLYANVNAHTMQDILSHSGSSIIFIGKLVAKDWEQQKIAIPPQIQTVTMEGHEKKRHPIMDRLCRKHRC